MFLCKTKVWLTRTLQKYFILSFWFYMIKNTVIKKKKNVKLIIGMFSTSLKYLALRLIKDRICCIWVRFKHNFMNDLPHFENATHTHTKMLYTLSIIPAKLNSKSTRYYMDSRYLRSLLQFHSFHWYRIKLLANLPLTYLMTYYFSKV